MALPFVSLDGADEAGVRAEVYVQTGEGIVERVNISDNKKTARVMVKVDGLKHAIGGWVNVDDPIFPILKEAKESGAVISYRIESQRKPSVDRKISITELRKDTASAQENTKSIFAGVNGQLSNEAVTNPAEDKAPGGRRRAIDMPAEAAAPAAGASAPRAVVTVDQVRKVADSGLAPSVVQMVAAAALAGGADVDEVVLAMIGGSKAGDDTRPERANLRSFAREEPAWKSYNSDGRVNYGSAAVTAGVGAETFIRQHLVEKDVISAVDFGGEETEGIVRTHLEAVLTISDKVQGAVYGDGFPVDRGANSHSRARGIVYDTISNYIPVAKDQDLEQWSTRVFDVALSRFRLAVEVSLGAANVSEPVSAPVQPAAPAAPKEDEFPADFFPRSLDWDASADKATTETVGSLKELVSEAQIENINTVGSLLRVTFGHAKASDLPEEALGAFVDFYITKNETDEPDFDTFRKACEWAAKH